MKPFAYIISVVLVTVGLIIGMGAPVLAFARGSDAVNSADLAKAAGSAKAADSEQIAEAPADTHAGSIEINRCLGGCNNSVKSTSLTNNPEQDAKLINSLVSPGKGDGGKSPSAQPESASLNSDSNAG